MLPLFYYFQHYAELFRNGAKRTNFSLTLVLIVTLVVVLSGGSALWLFEPELTFIDSIWWALVTTTTVGYGNITPTTLGGRIVAAVLMIVGIGVLGIVTGYFASLITNIAKLIRRGLMFIVDSEDHIIFAGWNDQAVEVHKFLRDDVRTEDTDIVLIANIESDPRPDDNNFYFVNGKVNKTTLSQANVEKSNTVYIFSRPDLEPDESDGQVVLNGLAVEELHSEAYTIAEVNLHENKEHCDRAGIDEVIVGNNLVSQLLSRAGVDHGITNAVSEILHPEKGYELHTQDQNGTAGMKFGEASEKLKTDEDAILVGLIQNGSMDINPPWDREIQEDEDLVVISDL